MSGKNIPSAAHTRQKQANSMNEIPCLSVTGAFWSPDPLHARAVLGDWLQPAGRPIVAGLFHASTFLPLPVMTPAALQVESGTRLLGFFRLPFVWLPDDVWGRYPGESLDIYQTRIFLAIHKMGLFLRKDNGTMTFADCLGGARPTYRQAAGLSHWFDQGATDDFVRPIFETMSDRAQHAWPNGYDPHVQESMAADLASFSAVGCLPIQVLTLASLFQQAQVEQDPTIGFHARQVLHALHGRYCTGGHDYFALKAPDDHNPAILVHWAKDHKGLADALLDRLVANGLADQRERDDWDATLEEAIQ